jgi:heterodisulfide reductase subunit A
MVSVGQHPNIELMTYSEVVAVEGEAGAFHVTIRKKPRYVDEDLCRGCGLCAEACRMRGRVVDTFNQGLSKRSAIYVPFPQAVPLIYTVDPTACLYLTRGVCGKTFLCKDACPTGAINFEQKEQFVEVDVAAIIVATGFDLIDPRTKPEFGYGVYPNVLTGLEFERLSSASGPTGGKVLVNGKEPKDVVFIHCVGSRDPHTGVPYCSRICCMYTAKHAHLVRDKLPDARITVFYIDMRAFGKGYEEFYDRVKEERVIYRRGEPSEVYKRGERLVVRAEDSLLGRTVEVEADLVVLATAVVPRADAQAVAELLGLERSPDGYFREAPPSIGRWIATGPASFWRAAVRGPRTSPILSPRRKRRPRRPWGSCDGRKKDRAPALGIGASDQEA